MNYDGEERRSEDRGLRDDVQALAESVSALDFTIQTAFVRRDELQDGYPGYVEFYAQVDQFRAEVKQDQDERARHQRRRLVWLGLTLALVAVLLAGASWREATLRDNTRRQLVRIALAERISSEIGHCERVNVLRDQIKVLHGQNKTLVVGILNSAGADVSKNGQPPFLDQIAPLLASYQKAVDSVEMIDCEQVTLGADHQQ